MFTEEVGVDPRVGDGGVVTGRGSPSWSHAGRAFARFDGDQVVFKAEIGALSRQVGQIQGVWVHPAYRGRGLGTVGTAAVTDRLAAMGRVSSLYVNGFNTVAKRAYARIGFRQVGELRDGAVLTRAPCPAERPRTVPRPRAYAAEDRAGR